MGTKIERIQSLLGDWKIKRELGKGSFGEVYEIEKTEFGATFSAALKVISIPQSEDDYKEALSEGMTSDSANKYFRSMVEEMTKEFTLMDKVKGNTNIVDYSDHKVIEREDGCGWDILIRMELLTPLEDFMNVESFSEDEVIRLGVDICRALEICDRLNIIHRDIKTANIFRSDMGYYKLGDFGIARVADKSKGASTKIGTKNYLAPEVFRGERYDNTVDIYSLGIVLYRLLNRGRLPFYPPYPQDITFSSKEEAIVKRLSGKEEFPALSCEHAGLFEVIKKACAFNHEDRFQTASEMRKALEAVANGTYEAAADPAGEEEKDIKDKKKKAENKKNSEKKISIKKTGEKNVDDKNADDKNTADKYVNGKKAISKKVIGKKADDKDNISKKLQSGNNKKTIKKVLAIAGWVVCFAVLFIVTLLMGLMSYDYDDGALILLLIISNLSLVVPALLNIFLKSEKNRLRFFIIGIAMSAVRVLLHIMLALTSYRSIYQTVAWLQFIIFAILTAGFGIYFWRRKKESSAAGAPSGNAAEQDNDI